MTDISVAQDVSRRQTAENFKPAMGAQRDTQTPPPGEAARQGLRPVDPSKKPLARRPAPTVKTALGQVLGIRLTPDLRARVSEAAKAVGVSDSSWLRQVALDALGVASPTDSASGRRVRVAPQDQAALAACIRDLGEATLSAQAGRTAEAVAAMQRAREVLVPVVIGFERRT